jgi:pimeloyl-ACP methyl ester carboxylesterase
MDFYPEITRWVIGGHSLGGSMAASYVDQNPGEIAGLILWASYPGQSDDPSDQSLPVTSIYGTMDGLTTPDEIFASRSLLPGGTDFVPVEGGNHAQFGWYGSQRGDNPASINRDPQQSQIVTATLALLSQLDE